MSSRAEEISSWGSGNALLKMRLRKSSRGVDLFRCESILLQSYWVMVVMDIFTRRIIGFGVAPANLGVMPPPLQCCENQH